MDLAEFPVAVWGVPGALDVDPGLGTGFQRETDPRFGCLRITVFLAGALLARRMGPFFILACAPVMAEMIVPQIRSLLRSRQSTAVVCVLIAVLAVGGVSYRIKDMQERSVFEYVTSADVFPSEACDYILREELPGPIFNELNYGSYLIWRLWPDYQIFVDNRNDIFYDGAFDAYMAATMSGGGSIWRQVFDKYGVNTVILDKDSILGDILIEVSDWRLIYRDSKAVIFMRASLLTEYLR